MIYNNDQEICDDYGFRFLDQVETPAVQLFAVGKQSRNTNQYYWNNKDRYPSFLFQYTLNGSGTLNVNNKTHIIKKGQAFFLQIPGDECYYFDDKINDAPWEFIYILLDGVSVLPYYKYVVNHLGKMMELAPFHPAIKLLFDIYNRAKQGLLQNAFAADSEVFRFLCLLCNSGFNTDHQSSLIENAKAYIDNNFSKPITLAETAEYLKISQSHLSREFVKHTGEQPIHYLTKIRLERATQMLISTNIRLNEISRLCGFSDSNYFSKVFKKYIKISPGEFRKQTRTQGYINVQV